MTLFLNVFIIIMALVVVDYFINRLKDKKPLMEKFFDISILLLAAVVIYFAVDKLTSLIFN